MWASTSPLLRFSTFSSRRTGAMAFSRHPTAAFSSSAISSGLVNLRVEGDIAHVTLGRPKVNALDGAMFAALKSRYEEAETTPGVRGIILSSEFPGVFSGGLDIPTLSSLSRPQLEEFHGVFIDALVKMSLSPLVTIAAINGHAPAGGCVLALTCDYRILSDASNIGLNEVAVGIQMPKGVARLAQSVLSPRYAQHVILTGSIWKSDEAIKYGLVDELAPLDEVVPRSQKVIRKWLDTTHSVAIAGSKQSLREDLAKHLLLEKENSSDFLDAWYGEETQRVLGEFKANLEKKKKAKL